MALHYHSFSMRKRFLGGVDELQFQPESISVWMTGYQSLSEIRQH